MNKRIIKFIPIIAMVIGFMIFKAGAAPHEDSSDAAIAVKKAEELRANAISKHPDLDPSSAEHQEAVEVSAKMLTSESNQTKRASTAADMFWGFYLGNTIERHEFCRDQGVDIRPFVTAFERVHAKELSEARSIYAKESADEMKLFAALKAQERKSVEQDMNGVASQLQISVKQACEFFSQHADELAMRMHLSKTLPAVYQTLSATK